MSFANFFFALYFVRVVLFEGIMFHSHLTNIMSSNANAQHDQMSVLSEL